MGKEQLMSVMVKEYNKDNWQLTAQAELETIALQKVMGKAEKKDIGKKGSKGLWKISLNSLCSSQKSFALRITGSDLLEPQLWKIWAGCAVSLAIEAGLFSNASWLPWGTTEACAGERRALKNEKFTGFKTWSAGATVLLRTSPGVLTYEYRYRTFKKISCTEILT